MVLGYTDPDTPVATLARHLGSTTAYFGFGGDAAAHEDWSSRSPSPGAFARSARKAGLVPEVDLYSLRALGRSGKDDATGKQIFVTLRNRRLMKLYWANVRAFLQSLGSARTLVALDVEASAWGELEGQLNESGARLDTVRAVVGSSGVRELRGLPDDLTGFARAWKALRDRYAPSVRLGYVLDDYATGLDISQAPPSRSAATAAGRQAGEFFRLVAGGLFDYTSIEVAFSEAGKEPKDAYSAEERDAFVAFVQEFSAAARTRVFLSGVPASNTVMRTIDDKPYHWHDDWVQWLIGDDSFGGLRELRDAGVIGIRFGGFGAPVDSTCPCDAAHDGVTNDGKSGQVSKSADDDGGYLAERMAALRRAGGAPLT
jgi:hypothetical protein